jgi:hypothetical protein
MMLAAKNAAQGSKNHTGGDGRYGEALYVVTEMVF